MGAMQQALLGDDPTTGENAKTTAWASAVVTAGGSVSAGRRTLINNLFNSLDSNSLTSKLDRLWLFAGENTQSATIDLINLQVITLVATPTFTTDRGYGPLNGTTQYLNTEVTPSAGGLQYVLNSASMGFYMRNDKPASATVEMGAQDVGTGNTSGISVAWSDNVNYFSVNDANGDGGRAAPADTSGIYILSRTGAGSTLGIQYRNGSSVGNNGMSSTTLPDSDILIGAQFDTGGVVDFFSTGQFACAFIGSGLDATQASNMNTVLQTYMTAVGA
jgi:hypothetical protein